MRQPLLFVLVGGIQYVLDAALFATLISAGFATVPSNVVSRANAAVVGFLLNRYVTFAHRADSLKRFGASLWRFVLLFIVLTILSTLALRWLEVHWGSDEVYRITAKLMVEALLAVASFTLSRFWVFRS